MVINLRLVILGILLSLFVSYSSKGQNDPLQDLENDSGEPQKDFQLNTFSSTRVINAQSTETQPQGALDFRISHRFGPVNSGAYNFFGLDQAAMRIAFEYGATNRLLVGIGRNTTEKTFDGFLKYKILWQAKGPKSSPVTLDYFVSAALTSLQQEKNTIADQFNSRLTYTHQLLIARKINKMFSVEVLPTYIHRNLVNVTEDNDVWAAGFAARARMNNVISFNIEYFYLLPGYTADTYYNSFSVGMDIKTGGHDFQLVFTNSNPMIEAQVIPQTTESWLKGGIHFGFNLSRVFNVGPRWGSTGSSEKWKPINYHF